MINPPVDNAIELAAGSTATGVRQLDPPSFEVVKDSAPGLIG